MSINACKKTKNKYKAQHPPKPSSFYTKALHEKIRDHSFLLVDTPIFDACLVACEAGYIKDDQSIRSIR
jgi:hypothetical protein